jgi:hypothetical protein
MKTSDLIKKSQSKRGAPGTLKRKVKGKMTLAKARALKNKPGATTLDKKQANFFINMHSQTESLWRNIHNKRARGEKMRKKGEKGAPTPDQIKRAQATSEEAPSTNTTSVAGAGDDGIVVIDRRRRKDKMPKLLKRFRKYIDDDS